MSTIEIQAAFSSGQHASEALLKLQALRAVDVSSSSENGSLSVTVDEAVADRAKRVIGQAGGTVSDR
ncbi:hypothetical protein ACFQZE_01800 [Paenibacillus sp. GCM10027627]|uniref:hypothetical protein n=1 Tax=unclassified Paenibacillus TaxID=185978 RepID=UPI00362C4D9C